MTLASEAELDDLYERYLVLLNKHQLQRDELSSNLSSVCRTLCHSTERMFNHVLPGILQHRESKFHRAIIRAVWSGLLR